LTTKYADNGTGSSAGSFQPRTLVSALGIETIHDTIASYIDYLETAVAVFERDGTLIGNMLTGNRYCRLQIEAIENDNDGGAARGFRDFYGQAVEAVVCSGQLQVITGAGMTICACPVTGLNNVAGVLIGVVSAPPEDDSIIRQIAKNTDIDFDLLQAAAREAVRQPDNIYAAARRHLSRLAGTIGRLYVDSLVRELAVSEAGACDLELATTRELDKRILNSMAEGAYTLDLDRNFTYLNAASERITGYKPFELIGKNISVLIPDDQMGILKKMIARRSEGFVDHYDLDLIRKDGGRVTINQTVSPILVNEENIGVVGVAFDVTEQRYLRARLEQQNQRLNLLQTVIKKSVSGLGRGHALKTLVDEVAATFGYDLCNIFMPAKDATKLQIVASHGYEEDFLRDINSGDTFAYENAHVGTMPAMVAFLQGKQEVLHDVSGETTEQQLSAAASKYDFTSMAATPLEYRGERLGSLVVYTRDVHEFSDEELKFLSSIAAQASTIAGSTLVYDQLMQSEERYRELYDSAADWMYTLDGNGIISNCNSTMARALGLPKEKIIGSYIYDFEIEADRESAREVLAAFGRQSEIGMAFTAERTFITINGSTVIVEVHAISLPDEASGNFQWRAVARDVTDKKEVEARFALMASAIENTHECVVITNLKGDIISINEAGAEMFGYDLEEMAGMRFNELWSDENPDELKAEILKETMADGWEGTLLQRRADGSSFPVYGSSSRVDDQSGNPMALVCIVRDLSVEQRMTTEILRRNRELAVLNAVAATTAGSLDLDSMLQASLGSVMDSMNYDSGVIYLMTTDGQAIEPHAEKGMPDEMIKFLHRIKIGDGYAGVVAAKGTSLFADDTISSPMRLNSLPDKSWFESFGGVPLVSNDKIMGVMMVGTIAHHDFDDTEKQLLESVGKTIAVAIDNALLFDDVTRSRNEWEATFDSMTNSVSIHDRFFTIRRANSALAKLLGTTTQDLVGQKCYEVFHKSSAPPVLCPMVNSLQDGCSHEAIIDETDMGSILSISADPIFDSEGSVIGIVHDVRDITEQEQLREQLTQSEKIRALGEMAGGVAHDFNNFLTVIMGNAQLLMSQLETKELDGDFRNSLESVQRAATDAAETVRRIQEFTRVRTARSFTTVELKKVLINSIEMARPRWRDEASARGVKIELHSDLSDLPKVNGNESELCEVFMNLLLNAVDALPEGGSIDLTTSMDKSGEWIAVSLADDGHGMDDDISRRIFEPFFSTKGVGGSGLGLSVAYGIIQRHGGDITVKSKKGKGTQFTVHLPVPKKADLFKSVAAETSGRQVLPSRVLVVDDEQLIRSLLGDMLESMGHSCKAAGSGSEGLELFAQASDRGEPFDLVITDLGMPEMSGWEVIDALKQSSPATPVALITGWGDQLSSEKMRESAVDTVIAKPFKVEDIRNLLAKVLA